jgi:hypothetical protein
MLDIKKSLDTMLLMIGVGSESGENKRAGFYSLSHGAREKYGVIAGYQESVESVIGRYLK